VSKELNGRYSFRFAGFDSDGKASGFLLGVGVMTFENGKLTGQHRSSVMPLQDGLSTRAQMGPAFVLPAIFKLDGTYKQSQQRGIWHIDVKFECNNPKQVMHCGFDFVPAAPGTLWIVSQSSAVKDPKTGKFQKVAEMVMGEAYKIA
jgi:hypothetical protein